MYSWLFSISWLTLMGLFFFKFVLLPNLRETQYILNLTINSKLQWFEYGEGVYRAELSPDKAYTLCENTFFSELITVLSPLTLLHISSIWVFLGKKKLHKAILENIKQQVTKS